MKKIAVSTILAGGLFAGLLGAAGAASAATVGDLVAPPSPVMEAPGAAINLPFGAGGSIGRDGVNASLPLNIADANINRDGVNASLPFGVDGSIGRDGAKASLPLGVGDVSINLGRR